ncbi:YiaA/YiaB family inner membrane protein [Streptomyces cavernicola]|uniref:YiaA/YiaB family inner membrane protein n=1 Tax=Streptomyces cavernicola TaxID=3043613 RepID=A0ABT6SGC1_9ACTN|nr:YiaA/YiaB family inner membrane protein [Streptomyces sp. B-S-A6]MDI3407255.1 YiaA/YiaB family inner membrane protein [Streptomyces sp. B-S-A6]
MTSEAPIKQQNTAAYYGMAVASFAVALAAVVIAILYMDVDVWIRAFLAIAMLYLVTSSFTLAKVVRDRQEAGALVSRVDQARMEKILADHDPFKTP